jgi:hypothetical protein
MATSSRMQASGEWNGRQLVCRRDVLPHIEVVFDGLYSVRELQRGDSDDEVDTGKADEEFQRAYPKRADPRDYLSKRTPEDVFKEFDVDGSGVLDLDEFIEMLPTLGIVVRSCFCGLVPLDWLFIASSSATKQ